MRIFSKKRIYADWAATTPVHPKVLWAIEKARKHWANPSSIYTEGVLARKALEKERGDTARVLGVKSEEVYFTSGGTEANSTIIQGVLRKVLERKVDPGLRREDRGGKNDGGSRDEEGGGPRISEDDGRERDAKIVEGLRPSVGWDPGSVHVVTSSIEHSSVLQTLKLFENHGVKVTYVNPDKNGIVQVADVLSAITPATVLVTIMYANNEIGTIQPISKIGAEIRKIRADKTRVSHSLVQGGENLDTDGHLLGGKDAHLYPVFHVDASQAPLWLSCDIEGLRADAMTLDAHKMQGPKGIGTLVVRRNVLWEPMMIGGGQERGKRSTTESLELVAGFTKALQIAEEGRGPRAKRAAVARDYFFKKLEKELPDAIVNGSLDKRLPNNINISLPNISDSEFAVLFLDKEGISCSTKSSCLKGEELSYVVKSLGGEDFRARNTLRFTLSPDVSLKEIDAIVQSLKKLPK